MKQNFFIKKTIPYPLASLLHPISLRLQLGPRNLYRLPGVTQSFFAAFLAPAKTGGVIIIFCFLFSFSVHPITYVYNLKIAPNTKLQSLKVQHSCPSIGALTLIQQWKEKYDETKQSDTGGMGTYIYNRNPWYWEVDWAAAKVRQENFSQIETDDILISGGYTATFSKNNKGTLTAMVGIPTHKDHLFDPISFGLGHFGLGIQFDDSWIYSRNRKNYLLTAFRYLRFLPRDVENCFDDITETFRFNIGNAIDLLIANINNWGKHKLEIGYNPTFAFGASIYPSVKAIVHATNGIRQGFYADYRYAFSIRKNHLAAISAGASYGFDSIPKDVGFKRVITIWATFGMCF